MREHIIKVYQYSELSEEAKEKALEWYRSTDPSEFARQECWDSAQKFAKCFGINLQEMNCLQHYVDADYPELGEVGDFDVETVGEYLKRHAPNLDGNCPFTGVCYDETYLDKIRENLENTSQDNDELKSVLESCLFDGLKAMNQEIEYRESREIMEEEIIANEYEFTENGKRF
jgi:hypothetical protein